jgi:uncharacterized protein YbjT (DUF2867 family)
MPSATRASAVLTPVRHVAILAVLLYSNADMTTRPDDTARQVFVSGGTGYMGFRLIPRLKDRGHAVTVLARQRTKTRVPDDWTVVVGDALDSRSFGRHVSAGATFVHLVGVARPAPWKAKQFREIDLASVQASLTAAEAAGVAHVIYVSVAHPAPVMKAYIAVRTACEALIAASGLHATILRPWYVIGPGHRWPLLLLPMYRLLQYFPGTAEPCRRLGLLTLNQMIDALVWAVEHPADGVRILTVPEIRGLAASQITARGSRAAAGITGQ